MVGYRSPWMGIVVRGWASRFMAGWKCFPLSMAVVVHGRSTTKKIEVHKGHGHRGAPEQEVPVMKTMMVVRLWGFMVLVAVAHKVIILA